MTQIEHTQNKRSVFDSIRMKTNSVIVYIIRVSSTCMYKYSKAYFLTKLDIQAGMKLYSIIEQDKIEFGQNIDVRKE